MAVSHPQARVQIRFFRWLPLEIHDYAAAAAAAKCRPSLLFMP